MANNIIDAQIDEQFNSLQLIIEENSDQTTARTHITNGMSTSDQLISKSKIFFSLNSYLF